MPDSASESIDIGLALLLQHYEQQRRQLETALQEKEVSLQRQADLLAQTEEKLRNHTEALERQLIASGRLVAVRELTASLAHELNNPLGIILGFAQERLSDIDPSDPSYRTLQIINEEASRCGVVVRDLLEFARPRAIEVIQTDVQQVVAKAAELLSKRLEQEKIIFQSDIDADIPTVDGDPQQLQQLLLNLCSNSLDAMSPGGVLSIAIKRAAAGTLAISVADSGFGIDAHDLSRIFEPFFSAKKRRGLGLGLPICQRIVKAHGGSIQVDSRPGEGATFTIYLPLRKTD
jgi:signal transduction histidine kinase